MFIIDAKMHPYILHCFILTVQFLCLNVILQTCATIMCNKRLLTYLAYLRALRVLLFFRCFIPEILLSHESYQLLLCIQLAPFSHEVSTCLPLTLFYAERRQQTNLTYSSPYVHHCRFVSSLRRQ